MHQIAGHAPLLWAPFQKWGFGCWLILCLPLLCTVQIWTRLWHMEAHMCHCGSSLILPGTLMHSEELPQLLQAIAKRLLLREILLLQLMPVYWGGQLYFWGHVSWGCTDCFSHVPLETLHFHQNQSVFFSFLQYLAFVCLFVCFSERCLRVHYYKNVSSVTELGQCPSSSLNALSPKHWGGFRISQKKLGNLRVLS